MGRPGTNERMVYGVTPPTGVAAAGLCTATQTMGPQSKSEASGSLGASNPGLQHSHLSELVNPPLRADRQSPFRLDDVEHLGVGECERATQCSVAAEMTGWVSVAVGTYAQRWSAAEASGADKPPLAPVNPGLTEH